ncbi:MAG: hypothetical protein ACRCW2_01640 [Cellulosilyticaceae bacterium]
MISVLFGVNVFICIITFLATSMLQNHFNKIHRSMAIYLDTKAYRPNSEVSFINKVLTRYQELSSSQSEEKVIVPHIDVEVMIHKALYEEHIGKFSYLGVQSMANKGKVVMWGILIVQIALDIMSGQPGRSVINFIFIVASTALCMVATLYSIIKSVCDKREQLVIKVHDYVVNTYPVDLLERTKQQEIKELMERIQKLESELETYQQHAQKPQGEKMSGKELMHLFSEIDMHV